MRIANPIYDVVFKYLMDDNDLAKVLLSTILGEEVLELTFMPQEHTAKIYPRNFTVYRLDFAAVIKNAEGEIRKALIELQKAKLATDIMRFRRYLGEQYKDDNNVITTDKGKKQALPLLTIYFLGYGLEHSKAPVIHVKRESRDVATDKPLAKKEGFIESLTHDSYIIQIAHLSEYRRTVLEELLQIFNQKWVVSSDVHILEINEHEISEQYWPFLRRLQRAIAEKEVEEEMNIEDEVLSELQDLERKIEQERVEKERAQAEAEQAQAQAEQERIEKERAQAEAEQAQAQAEQAQAQAEQAQAQAEQAQAQAEQAQAEAEQERVVKEHAQAEAEQAQAKVEQAEAENQHLLALLKQAGIEPTR